MPTSVAFNRKYILGTIILTVALVATVVAMASWFISTLNGLRIFDDAKTYVVLSLILSTTVFPVCLMGVLGIKGNSKMYTAVFFGCIIILAIIGIAMGFRLITILAEPGFSIVYADSRFKEIWDEYSLCTDTTSTCKSGRAYIAYAREQGKCCGYDDVETNNLDCTFGTDRCKPYVISSVQQLLYILGGTFGSCFIVILLSHLIGFYISMEIIPKAEHKGRLRLGEMKDISSRY